MSSRVRRNKREQARLRIAAMVEDDSDGSIEADLYSSLSVEDNDNESFEEQQKEVREEEDGSIDDRCEIQHTQQQQQQVFLDHEQNHETNDDEMLLDNYESVATQPVNQYTEVPENGSGNGDWNTFGDQTKTQASGADPRSILECIGSSSDDGSQNISYSQVMIEKRKKRKSKSRLKKRSKKNKQNPSDPSVCCSSTTPQTSSSSLSSAGHSSQSQDANDTSAVAATTPPSHQLSSLSKDEESFVKSKANKRNDKNDNINNQSSPLSESADPSNEKSLFESKANKKNEKYDNIINQQLSSLLTSAEPSDEHNFEEKNSSSPKDKESDNGNKVNEKSEKENEINDKSDTKDKKAKKKRRVANFKSCEPENKQSTSTGTATANKTSPAKQLSAKAKPSPKKKRKRTFQDQILHHMLVSAKPYTLKSLAQSTRSTEEALNSVMLSLIDKNLVVKKEFTSAKSSRTKILYWANQNAASTSKDIDLCKASPEDIRMATDEANLLKKQLAVILDEVNKISQTPTNRDVETNISLLEQDVDGVRRQVEGAKERIQQSSKGSTQDNSPRALKLKINKWRNEWRQRKEKCIDFVDNLADAMEKKVKDVNKLLEIETDEAEGVKIPAKYII